jgi:hypothetical protein
VGCEEDADDGSRFDLSKNRETEGSLRCVAARSCLPRKLPLPGTFARGGTGRRKKRAATSVGMTVGCLLRRLSKARGAGGLRRAGFRSPVLEPVLSLQRPRFRKSKPGAPVLKFRLAGSRSRLKYRLSPPGLAPSEKLRAISSRQTLASRSSRRAVVAPAIVELGCCSSLFELPQVAFPGRLARWCIVRLTPSPRAYP